jgi:hypothetical protein
MSARLMPPFDCASLVSRRNAADAEHCLRHATIDLRKARLSTDKHIQRLSPMFDAVVADATAPIFTEPVAPLSSQPDEHGLRHAARRCAAARRWPRFPRVWFAHSALHHDSALPCPTVAAATNEIGDGVQACAVFCAARANAERAPRQRQPRSCANRARAMRVSAREVAPRAERPQKVSLSERRP